ncbi:MAG TPA: MFS transporter [Gallionellaceae bacterium]|nr:MFS transporter [Gallionellaceae bacterium]
MHPPLAPQREKYLLLTLAGIQFSHVLDFMIMMPLGPILIAEFGITTHEFGLLVASYSFSAAASGLLAATFVDRFERKRLLLTMFTLFGLATLACGLAPGYATLLIARGLAGAFGGVMGALVQTMIGDVIPFARRARASSMVSAAFSISTVAGVPLSLWLANHFQWRAPFVFIAVLVALFILVGLRVLPEMRHHISPSTSPSVLSGAEGSGQAKQAHPFAAMFTVLRDANHLRALLFSALIIFSGFTVIPYITLYSVHNVGISQHDIPLVYFAGGAATLVTARLIGHWADLHGKIRVYRLVAVAALLPLFVVTHIGAVPLWLWLICTTTFFVLVSGRMIPAMAIITSAAQPRLRGTFMSLNATTQAFAMGLASTLAGFIISQDNAGHIADYGMVGYVAMAANLLAVWFVSRITMHGQRAVVPPQSSGIP